jgi:hypothetical protein
MLGDDKAKGRELVHAHQKGTRSAHEIFPGNGTQLMEDASDLDPIITVGIA